MILYPDIRDALLALKGKRIFMLYYRLVGDRYNPGWIGIYFPAIVLPLLPVSVR